MVHSSPPYFARYFFPPVFPRLLPLLWFSSKKSEGEVFAPPPSFLQLAASFSIAVFVAVFVVALLIWGISLVAAASSPPRTAPNVSAIA